MIVPVLNEDERSALEALASSGPERALDPPLRGRLALYKLIDETPEGWKITALGRDALAAARSQAGKTPSDAAEAGAAAPEDTESTHAASGRHYGRKARDTSWLD